jgi:chemotaxis protein MotA
MADDTGRISPSLAGFSGAPPSVPPGGVDPTIRIARPKRYIDMVTIIALLLSLGLVWLGISLGNQNANFLDIPSVLIVVLGTISVTCISYTGREIMLALPMIWESVVRGYYNPKKLTSELLDLAVLTRRRGILIIGQHSNELNHHPFLNNTIQMAADGMLIPDIERMIYNDIDVMLDGYKKAAGMLRRASEIAPAMGLIGTLIGLVQMLVSLDDPSSIGPAMALALLTTFYGAMMGSVVLAPLAAKIERNANENVLIKTLIKTATTSIITQSNPRKLELELNALLSPDQRVQYFNYGT